MGAILVLICSFISDFAMFVNIFQIQTFFYLKLVGGHEHPRLIVQFDYRLLI